MTYSVTLITNRVDCQAVIDLANNAKQILEYRKMGLTIRGANAGTNLVSFEANLASAIAEATVLQAVLDSLPPGTVRDETMLRFKQADLRKTQLELRKNSNGPASILEKEYDVACIEQSIAQADVYIQALIQRFNELPVV